MTLRPAPSRSPRPGPLSVLVLACALVGVLAACAPSIEPSGDPLVDQMSADERTLFESNLEFMAEYYGVENPPRYEVVRWVLTEEADAVRRECMGTEGFPANPDGSIDFGAQFDAFQAANFACLAKYPIDPRYAHFWTDVQIKAQYRWNIDVFIPCLEIGGATVTDIPSEAAFVDSWWTAPFQPMSQAPVSSWAQIEARCPNQQAPDAVLWDGVEPTDHPIAALHERD